MEMTSSRIQIALPIILFVLLALVIPMQARAGISDDCTFSFENFGNLFSPSFYWSKRCVDFRESISPSGGGFFIRDSGAAPPAGPIKLTFPPTITPSVPAASSALAPSAYFPGQTMAGVISSNQDAFRTMVSQPCDRLLGNGTRCSSAQLTEYFDTGQVTVPALSPVSTAPVPTITTLVPKSPTSASQQSSLSPLDTFKYALRACDLEAEPDICRKYVYDQWNSGDMGAISNLWYRSDASDSSTPAPMTAEMQALCPTGDPVCIAEQTTMQENADAGAYPSESGIRAAETQALLDRAWNMPPESSRPCETWMGGDGCATEAVAVQAFRESCDSQNQNSFLFWSWTDTAASRNCVANLQRQAGLLEGFSMGGDIPPQSGQATLVPDQQYRGVITAASAEDNASQSQTQYDSGAGFSIAGITGFFKDIISGITGSGGQTTESAQPVATNPALTDAQLNFRVDEDYSTAENDAIVQNALQSLPDPTVTGTISSGPTANSPGTFFPAYLFYPGTNSQYDQHLSNCTERSVDAATCNDEWSLQDAASKDPYKIDQGIMTEQPPETYTTPSLTGTVSDGLGEIDPLDFFDY